MIVQGVTFEIVAPFPDFAVDETGFRPTVHFKLADATQWETFVGMLFGRYEVNGPVVNYLGPDIAIPFAGWEDTICVSAKIEPYTEGDCIVTATDLDTFTYSISGGSPSVRPLRITAEYATDFIADPIKLHKNASNDIARHGTFFRLHMPIGGEFQTIPGDFLYWQTASVANQVPRDVTGAIPVVGGDMAIEWFYIARPPWDTIKATVGAVNVGSPPFFGYDDGTLMFLGCEPIMVRRFQKDTVLWRLIYHFKSNIKTKLDGTRVGHNYMYRNLAISDASEPWQLVVNGNNQPLIREKNFNDLFTYE